MRTAVTKTEARARLSRADWVLAGFQALVDKGPEAVRVEPIARALGATKGSFYWHFKDLRALHAAMLDAWERLAATEVTTAVRRSDLPPREQVLLLADLVSIIPEAEAGGQAVEPAIRDWGRVDALAREVLARTDRQRLEDLRGFLGAAGLDEAAAEEGAVVFYAALIGLEALRATTGTPMRPALRAVAEGILGMRGGTG
jgi:AcrR family transcriptional regulator